MKNKNRTIFFIFFLIIPAFACQFLDNILGESSDPAGPTTPQATQVVDSTIPTATESLEVHEQDEQPTLTASSATEAPPPLPQIVPRDESESGLTMYESPAGYRFDIPATWTAADYFGQTIATNDPAVLSTGELTNNQLLMLFVAGAYNDSNVSAEQLLEDVQNNILASYLAEGSLSPLTGPEPAAQAGAKGVQTTHQLSGDNGENLFVRSLALISRNLYVVFIGIAPETNQEKLDETLIQIADSLALTSGEYLASATTYGLSEAELQALNSELTASAWMPDTARSIDFGETTGSIGANEVALLQFSAEAGSSIDIALTPKNANFDPIIDIIGSAGESILLAALDTGAQGEAESIENLSIPTTDNYRIVVRGFGFSNGEFTLQLSSGE